MQILPLTRDTSLWHWTLRAEHTVHTSQRRFGKTSVPKNVTGTEANNLLPLIPPPLPIVEGDSVRLADSLLQSLSGSVNVGVVESSITAADTTRSPAGPAGRMRSSIACIRCRRSKVKCVNNGVGTQCRSCENSGRECSYPSPVTGGTTRRRESSTGAKGDVSNNSNNDGERRVRPRKSTQTFVQPLQVAGVKDSAANSTGDALDARFLTPAVWLELFDIFQIHFSVDLPFLHAPTFQKVLRQASTDGAESVRPAASPEFLLAFLALTARFHPKLVAHHNPANPLDAAKYYAANAHVQLALAWSHSDTRQSSLEHVQAMLMLGMHEWGMCHGLKAYLTIGCAIRTAQAIGLQYEPDLDDERLSISLAARTSDAAGALGFVQEEIRRRTFWSCFIMDRYTSSGKYRPQMLHVEGLRIQLPASERSFLFEQKVRTKMLGEDESGRTGARDHRENVGASPVKGASPDAMDEEEDIHLETGADEGLLSRYVKILEIYGKVMRWACAGGRRYAIECFDEDAGHLG